MIYYFILFYFDFGEYIFRCHIRYSNLPFFYYFSFGATYYTISRNIINHNGACTNYSIIPNCDIADKYCAGIYCNIIAYYWGICLIGISNCNLLINPAVLSYFLCGDNSGKAVLDKQPFSNIIRMDVQAR